MTRDNALAETINGLYKTELIKPRKPWCSIEEVELATAQWVDWFTTAASTSTAVTSRLSIWRPPTTLNTGDQPPAEFSDQKVSGHAGAVHCGRNVLDERRFPRTRLRAARSVVGISLQVDPLRVRVGLGPVRRSDNQRARGGKLVPVLISVPMVNALVCGEVHRECHISSVP